MGWIETLAVPLIPFGLGILAGMIIKRWEIRHLRPVIIIEDGVIRREFNLSYGDRKDIPFIANRIKVRNRGRTGAQGCKVYVEFAENEKERTAWMLPDNDTAHTLTLNVDIPEYVDLCAISEDANTRIISPEYGYRMGTVESCRILSQENLEVTIRVTSSNAQPAERTVRLYETVDHFPKQHGRIVEFIT